ncbi:Uncharacterised protein [uncultured archaeon]|nr:Uncharacterised protein [uncultured archaeon]
MGYEIALGMAWGELEELCSSSVISISFLAEDYLVKIGERTILQSFTGARAPETEAVLILHYLIGLEKCGYKPSGEWISFKETEGGKAFWPAFQETVIKPLTKSFHSDPKGIVERLQGSLGGRLVGGGDVAVEVVTFPGVFVRLIFWRGDEELPAEATMLFDRALSKIYCMEDVDALLLVLAKRAIA